MIHQISVFLENRAGQLVEITNILAGGGIDLRAINIAEAQDYGVLRLIADDARRAAALLSEQDFVVSVTPVVAVAVSDRAGTLNQVLSVIAGGGIDIGYMYSSFGKEDGVAYMIFRVDAPEKLTDVLTAAGIAVAAPADLGIRE